MKYANNFFEFLGKHEWIGVSIDFCHNVLVFGLVTSLKPKKVLELGIGAGYTTRALVNAIKYNKNDASVTCVDNWHDWQGVRPPIAKVVEELGATVVESGEQEFVLNSKDSSYDFIMVDGDHRRGGYWAQKVCNMVTPGGIICVHDIGEEVYPTLKNYLTIAKEMNYSHFVFDKVSREGEQCDSGLLVIFKDK